MFHYRRRQLEDRDRQEAAGVSFWTDEFEESARVKLGWAIRRSLEDELPLSLIKQLAGRLIVEDMGWKGLWDGDTESHREFDVFLEEANDEYLPMLIEATHHAMTSLRQGDEDNEEWLEIDPDEYSRLVNDVLHEYRISFQLVGGQMVELHSQEMHAEVVEPVLRLLSGKPGWEVVEKAYQDALGELHAGSPDDAITDAATALEEALAAIGCTGNSLGRKVRDARDKRLLAPHDSPMVDAITKLVDWANADRAALGDAHPGGDPSPEDGWLAVHVIGALILRLAEGTTREG